VLRPLFDAHFHVIDPAFGLVANAGYTPEPFPADAYRERVAALGVTGGAVVAASFQTGREWLLAALAALGPRFVGVAELTPDMAEADVLALDAAGVRAVRLNLHRSGRAGLDRLEAVAERVHALAGWHVELYADGATLAELEPRLAALPALCIDHLGLDRAALPVLLRLVAGGAKVKASGFGRGDLDVPATLRAIDAVDPSALLFATDLPSTRVERAFADADVALVAGSVADPAAALHDNAVAFYRPRET
jgi:predicted TIM-barrel fold metal-dependent hydrolase